MANAWTVICLGEPIIGQGSWSARVRGVKVEAERLEVEDLVVERGLVRRSYLIPFRDVTRSPNGVLAVPYPERELTGHKIASRREYGTVGHVVSRSTSLLSDEKRLGRVTHVIIDAKSSTLVELVVKGGREKAQFTLVPTAAISLEGDDVRLSTTEEEFLKLPIYRPDADIAYAVDRALYNDPITGPVDYKGIRLVVDSQQVTLHGNVRAPSARNAAEKVTGAVDGVLGVTNEIVSDWELEMQIAGKLAQDSRTSRARILVHSSMGRVRLEGNVSSAEIRSAADEVTALVFGPVTVSNSLHEFPE